jgi:lipoyl(octanoyl) transferase
MLTWQTSDAPVEYEVALAAMEAHVAAMLEDRAGEKIWLLEHPSLYTAGTSAQAQELLTPSRFPVYQTGRGGRYTYHGPGQRIGYVMADLRVRGKDIRKYVCALEAWVMAALAEFGVNAERREGRVGIWVSTNGREEKIAALGVRVRRWVAYHGIAINVAPDLDHFSGIVPCGLSTYGVTSLKKLGMNVPMALVDEALKHHWPEIFPDLVGQKQ